MSLLHENGMQLQPKTLLQLENKKWKERKPSALVLKARFCIFFFFSFIRVDLDGQKAFLRVQQYNQELVFLRLKIRLLMLI